MVLGDMTCMWSSMDGGLIDYEFGRLILLLSSLYTLYLDLNHVWLLCLSLGRGQLSVKPTGHARFSVETISPNLETYKLFS